MRTPPALPPPAGISLHTHTLPDGTRLACRSAGASAGASAGGRRAILLHGFPEAAFVWDDMMLALAADGLHCVAPNQRGYAGSSAPEGVAAYRAKHLVADLQALLDIVCPDGAPLDLLVAHDWGGGVAWNLAALQPQRIRRLVIINSPHPATFQRELRHSAAQQAASAYMLDLVRPDAAGRLAADDFASLWQLLDRFGGAHWLTPALRQAYRATWAAGLDGALNWYRASPLRPPASADDTALADLVLPPSVVNVAVPTTVLWGEADHALLPGLLDGLGQWVPDLTVHRHPQASHWIVHEQPAWVLAHLRQALA